MKIVALDQLAPGDVVFFEDEFEQRLRIQVVKEVLLDDGLVVFEETAPLDTALPNNDEIVVLDLPIEKINAPEKPFEECRMIRVESDYGDKVYVVMDLNKKNPHDVACDTAEEWGMKDVRYTTPIKRPVIFSNKS